MKNYIMLTKPGIIFGNAITAAAGFGLASQGHFDPWLFLAMLVGVALVIASACVFNNFIDRALDQKMARTKNRPLVTGAISTTHALLFGTAIGLLGVVVLLLFTNLLATSMALVGFFSYVVLYSCSKQHTTFATEIGSVAGAMPPVVGYTAVTNQLDVAALLLFMLLVFWQMPHFFSIAMFRLEEYKAASIPVAPAKKGIERTKREMFFYIVAFLVTLLLFPFFGYTGVLFLGVSLCLGIGWLWLAFQGFSCNNDQLWARKMFRVSLVVITLLSVVMPL